MRRSQGNLLHFQKMVGSLGGKRKVIPVFAVSRSSPRSSVSTGVQVLGSIRLVGVRAVPGDDDLRAVWFVDQLKFIHAAASASA